MAANRVRSNWTITNGAITTLAVSQQVFAQNNGRQFFSFQNTSDTAMWLNFGTAAATNVGIQVPAGTTFTFPPDFTCPEAINVVCSAATKTFAAYQI